MVIQIYLCQLEYEQTNIFSDIQLPIPNPLLIFKDLLKSIIHHSHFFKKKLNSFNLKYYISSYLYIFQHIYFKNYERKHI